MRRVHADLLLLACAAIWGLSFLFQKSAMAHIGPWTFVAARGLIAALVLTPLLLWEQHRAAAPAPRRLLILSMLAGAAFLTAAMLQQNGLKTASVMNTGFLTALYVVLTPFVSFALLRHSIAPGIWAAAAMSFAGMWLLGGGTLDRFGDGDALVACSTVFWALNFVLAGMAAPVGRPVLFTTLQFAVVAVSALAGALLWEPISATGLHAAAVDILYVAVLSGALTFTVLTLALRATSPTEAAVIISMDTVFAALGAWLVLDERLSAAGAVGAAAILAAVLLVQLNAAWRR